jgi:drug/metabolite transporter (DMT)-like permease
VVIAYIGEIASIATSLLWSISSSLFTVGGKRKGTFILNRLRLLGATILFLVTHLIVIGAFFPSESLYVWLLLGLSGIIGLALGDGFLFLAYMKIGPRMSMLLMSLAPIVTTASAWILLGETLSIFKIIGIAITIGGVSFVIMEKRPAHHQFKVTTMGVLFGLGGMLGQAIQLVMAKEAMGHMVSENIPLSASLIRLMWGTSAVWFVAVIGGKVARTLRSVTDKKFVHFVILATIFGPFLGIWASYIAIQYADLGVASTLMSLSPLFLIPISRIVFKERITVVSVVGTVVAMVGVAILFLAP